MSIKCYSDLILLPTFEERFEYVKIGQNVGEDTFGSRRYLNQIYYHTYRYKKLRQEVILRDNGRDLACPDRQIGGLIILHHLNPITVEDILNETKYAWDPEYMISVSEYTHKAIHYSDIDLIPKPFVERRANDTCPWKL